MKFIVSRREIWIQDTEIEAESIDEALELVNDGEGTEVGEPRYHSTDDDADESDVSLAEGCADCGSHIIDSTSESFEIAHHLKCTRLNI